MAVARQRPRQGRGIAPEIRRALDLGPGLGDRLAGFQRLGPGDPLAVTVDQVGDLQKQRRAVLARQAGPAPVVEGGAGGRDGRLGLGRAALRSPGHHDPMGGRAAVEGRAVAAPAPDAVDQVAHLGGPGGQRRAGGGHKGQVQHSLISPERRVGACRRRPRRLRPGPRWPRSCRCQAPRSAPRRPRPRRRGSCTWSPRPPAATG